MTAPRILAVALVILAGCAPQREWTMVRRHPDLLHLQWPHSIAVVPPDVTVVEMQFVGDGKRLEDAEAGFVDGLNLEVTEQFRTRGFEVKPARLEDADLGDDDVLRGRLATLEQRARQVSFKLYRKGALPIEEVESIRASVGPLVNLFAERAGVDALALVKMEAVVKSTGQQRFDTFMTILHAVGGAYYNPPESGAILNVVLVDGVSGDVLWANRLSMVFQGALRTDPLVRAVVEPLPVAAALRAVAASP